jgi:isovaleryl-CoA dehydrogenase
MAMICLKSLARVASPRHSLLAASSASPMVQRSMTHYPIDDKIYGLSDDHRELRESVFNFCQKELAPHAATIDKENNFKDLRQFWRKLVRVMDK